MVILNKIGWRRTVVDSQSNESGVQGSTIRGEDYRGPIIARGLGCSFDTRTTNLAFVLGVNRGVRIRESWWAIRNEWRRLYRCELE